MDDGMSLEMMHEAIENALDAMDGWPLATGLAGVMYPEESNGRMGWAVAWEMYVGPDILSAYRVNMRTRVRPDMVGMMLGVKNILPPKEVRTEVSLELMAHDKELNVHNVSKAMDDILARKEKPIAGDSVLMVTALTKDHRWASGRRMNGGPTELFHDIDDWDSLPGMIAMRYWMDMPV